MMSAEETLARVEQIVRDGFAVTERGAFITDPEQTLERLLEIFEPPVAVLWSSPKYSPARYPTDSYVIEQVEGGWRWKWEEEGSLEYGGVVSTKAAAYRAAARDWDEHGGDGGKLASTLNGIATRIERQEQDHG